ncbi:uncharacterized protein G2W53_030021 [Senna tora]|uniref:Uncharacterized protein n=1 Tax=Senna tora TaxID=362788 RepID=A0A834WB96_9FABA|nr:uncharacterized protein G2W53_030021 [Senna tora]
MANPVLISLPFIKEWDVNHLQET